MSNVESKVEEPRPVIGRPKHTSTRGVLALIRSYADKEVTPEYVRRELVNIYSKLHADKDIKFLEEVLEEKWYISDDLINWVQTYGVVEKEIDILGRKIFELVLGRIKKSVAASELPQTIAKFLLTADYNYDKRGTGLTGKSTTSIAKSASLDVLLDKLGSMTGDPEEDV
jgi:hypothetical protein